MTEDGPLPLPEDLRALVKRAARIGAAPAGTRARVLARVEAGVGIAGPGGGGHGGTGGSQAPPALPAAPATLGLARRLFPFAISFVLGGGAGGLLVARSLRVPAPDVAPRVVHVDRPVAIAPAPAPAVAEPADAPARVPAPAPVAVRRRAQVLAQNPFNAERRLLDIARGALERGQPAAALDATARHERAFPGGMLVQERESMAIRALAMLGRRTEARARAGRFHDRFPDSVLWPAIQSSIGAAPGP